MGPWEGLETSLVAAAVACGVMMGCDCDGELAMSGSCIIPVIFTCSHGMMMVIILMYLYAHAVQSACVNNVIRVSLL